jgi:hypothetical protein
LKLKLRERLADGPSLKVGRDGTSLEFSNVGMFETKDEMFENKDETE